ncbi:hypothetical protein [Enterococcus rivorum]|uniref:Uncharacterized protein n=1 Tax=Enterococcus rivorum TaxID=762845 RepID=A0A1E5L0U3_9ENTE|nr:hypothetical protein [Enterococcus rivorum]MBP2098443.1 hypothetical protein [Enterococcus rivorum]OEH83703.1 hypothetical protein BCR26_08530 [Enterococcus rivorum]
MSSIIDYLEKIEKQKSIFVYVDDLLLKEEITYAELVFLLNEFAKNLPTDQFLQCQTSSETEISVNDSKELLNLLIDTEWDMPSIESSQNLIWHPKENERVITIEGLSETLVAVYYVQSNEHYLTVVSKEVFNNRSVSTDVLELLIQISNGDMAILDSSYCMGKKKFKEVIDYLVKVEYIFVVRKNLVDNIESIAIEPIIDWKQKENYSVEFTNKGRECYTNKDLGIGLTTFISGVQS